MPSIYTNILRLELQADGENDGTWGQIANDNVFALLEDAVAGTASISTTGGTTTLSTNNGAVDQARNKVLDITGSLGSDAIIEVPAQSKTYYVRNATSGSQTVEVLVAGQSAGAGIKVPQGETQALYCDGSNVEAAAPSVPGTGADALRSTDFAANGGTIPETNRVNNFSGGVQQQNGNDILDVGDLGAASAQIPQNSTIFNLASLSVSQGDILYVDGNGDLQNLGAGTSGQYLQTQGGTAAPTWADVGGQNVVVNTVTASSTVSVSTIPEDATPPQNTEGTSLGSQFDTTITPKDSTSTLLVEVQVFLGEESNFGIHLIAMLFRDNDADCIGIGYFERPNDEWLAAAITANYIRFKVAVPANSTSPTTFKLRAASDSSGTFRINGLDGTEYFGDALTSHIIVSEV